MDMFYIEMEKRRAKREGRKRFLAPCRICAREEASSRRKEKQDYSDSIKLKNGCADCGIKINHPEIYDFDHLPQFEKKISVSAALTKGTFEDFKDEVAKCEVVCANCHRIRTRQRGQLSNFGRSRK